MKSLLSLILLAVAGVTLAACKPQNTYAPPPAPQVGVATPVQQTVSLFMEQTGNTEAYNSVDLVARVEGYLSEIKYQDGAAVKRGDTLFVIEPAPYQAQLEQAKAALSSAQAQLVYSQSEFDRKANLVRTDTTSRADYDQARAKRDSDQANVLSQQAAVAIAAINLGYTRVSAPFDGVVTRHLISVGELVGASSKTKLATIVQLDPIYVTFNVSEQDALKVRANLGGRHLTLAEIAKVPIEIGLMDESGYPHRGFLDYISPKIDPATGTILVRAIFKNPDRTLLPGFFVRIRVPMGREEQNALLVPDRVLGQNQDGRYVLVLGKENLVEQRKVEVGQRFGDLRVIASGLKPEDRVIVTGTGRAIPGRKVDPQPVKLAAVTAATMTAAK